MEEHDEKEKEKQAESVEDKEGDEDTKKKGKRQKADKAKVDADDPDEVVDSADRKETLFCLSLLFYFFLGNLFCFLGKVNSLNLCKVI
jgi:hypothetical protein